MFEEWCDRGSCKQFCKWILSELNFIGVDIVCIYIYIPTHTFFCLGCANVSRRTGSRRLRETQRFSPVLIILTGCEQVSKNLSAVAALGFLPPRLRQSPEQELTWELEGPWQVGFKVAAGCAAVPPFQKTSLRQYLLTVHAIFQCSSPPASYSGI